MLKLQAMTDEEFAALEKRNEEVLALIEEQRKQFGTELWWREDAIGIRAAKDCAVAIEEIKRLRIEVASIRCWRCGRDARGYRDCCPGAFGEEPYNSAPCWTPEEHKQRVPPWSDK